MEQSYCVCVCVCLFRCGCSNILVFGICSIFARRFATALRATLLLVRWQFVEYVRSNKPPRAVRWKRCIKEIHLRLRPTCGQFEAWPEFGMAFIESYPIRSNTTYTIQSIQIYSDSIQSRPNQYIQSNQI